MVSTAGIVSEISNDKALSLFKAVALSENLGSSILITKLRLSRGQYYTLMEKLIHAGLVKKINGRYSLTSFGKVISSFQAKVEAEIKTATKHYWELKAVDSIMMKMSAQNIELPLEEHQKIIDNLIDNQEIKSILLSKGILITR